MDKYVLHFNYNIKYIMITKHMQSIVKINMLHMLHIYYRVRHSKYECHTFNGWCRNIKLIKHFFHISSTLNEIFIETGWVQQYNAVK